MSYIWLLITSLSLAGTLSACARKETPPNEGDAQTKRPAAETPRSAAAPAYSKSDSLDGWTLIEAETVWDDPPHQSFQAGTRLRFANGRAWNTAIIRAGVLGVLSRDNRAPFIVLSGRPCDECDATPGVWIASPDDGPLTSEMMRQGFAFPGDVDVFDVDTLGEPQPKAVYSSRLFLGRCFPRPYEAAVWLERSLVNGQWIPQIVAATSIGGVLHVDTLASDPATRDSIAARVRVALCREIPGQGQMAY